MENGNNPFNPKLFGKLKIQGKNLIIGPKA
jgi:hypothetical protein